MPTPYLKKLSEQKNIPLSKLEHNWEKAKEIAANEGHAQDWPYIVGILKRMIKASMEATSSSDVSAKEVPSSVSASSKAGLDQKWFKVTIRWKSESISEDYLTTTPNKALNWALFDLAKKLGLDSTLVMRIVRSDKSSYDVKEITTSSFVARAAVAAPEQRDPCQGGLLERGRLFEQGRLFDDVS